jgi:hypothetical protein
MRTVRQPAPLGSADAVTRAVASGATPPLLVMAADTAFTPGDIGLVVERWSSSSEAVGAVGVRRGGRPHQTLVRVEDGRVTGFDVERAEHSAAPIWVLGHELTAALAGVAGPPFEVASAVHHAVAAGKEFLAIEMRPTRDITRPADVLAHNFPYLLSWER